MENPFRTYPMRSFPIWLLPFLFAPLALPAIGVKDQVPSKLKNDLRSRWEKDRQMAVRKLAALGNEQAWELVLGALQDAKGQVADEAQAQLAGPDCPGEVWRELYGEVGLDHREEWVRLRAAEVLGRLPGPVEGRELVDALDRKNPLVSAGVLKSLAGLEARGALDWGKNPERGRERAARAAAKLLRMPGRAGSLALLAMVELLVTDLEGAGQACLDAVRAKEPLRRAAGLRGLQRLQHGQLETRAREALLDPEGAVRSVAMEILQAVGTRSALEALVGRIDVEPREKILLELVPRLRAMTGYKAGRHGQAWRAYVADLEPDWRSASSQWRGAGDVVDEAEDEGKSLAGGAGLPTFSDRICYLLDFSGSIWNVGENGKSSKEMLDPLLHATLDALGEEARFNLAPYTGEVEAWQAGLVQAKRAKVQGAHKFIDRIKITGPGDFFAAVEWALLDPEVDTICVLTDGAPTGGRRWQLDLMVQNLLQQNELRPIRFDVVLVDCPKGLATHWAHLAEGSGGSVQAHN